MCLFSEIIVHGCVLHDTQQPFVGAVLRPRTNKTRKSEGVGLVVLQVGR